MIQPYQNNTQSMQVGNLVIENQQDKISIYGDIDLYQNAQGLQDAQKLQALLDNIVQTLIKQQLTTNPLTTNKEQAHGQQINPSQNGISQINNPFL